MDIINWFKSRFSHRAKALALYRRGMLRAHQQDNRGAIEDYDAAIEMADGPQDVKAMALFNRALIYAADGDDQTAIKELNKVIAMAKTPDEVRTEARRRLERMRRRSSDADERPT